MPVTEIGCHGVKPGVDFMAESTHEGQILTAAWKAATSEKTGPYNLYWGMEVENPSNFWGFFDFDSVEDHEKFAKEHGARIVKDMIHVFERPQFTKHVDFKPFPPSALKSPVTEIMLAYFPSDISAEGKEAASERVAQFIEKGLNKCADVQAVNHGWGVENDFPVRGGEEGHRGNALVALIGWPSIDAHTKFRDTEAFKENVGLLRGLEGMVKLTMCHVKCRGLENKTRKG